MNNGDITDPRNILKRNSYLMPLSVFSLSIIATLALYNHLGLINIPIFNVNINKNNNGEQ